MQGPTAAQRPAWTRTQLSIWLGLDYPIVQGPLGGFSSQRLTAAVCHNLHRCFERLCLGDSSNRAL